MENLEEVKIEAGVLSDCLIHDSNALFIRGQNDLKVAADYQLQAKDEIKVIEAAFKPHKDNAFKAHKDLCKAESEQLAPFKSIVNILKPKIIAYQNAEEERERLEREAKVAAQRIEEAKAKAEAEKAKEAQAEALMDAGDFDKAEAVLEAPTHEPMAAFVPEAPKEKIAGAGTKKVWKGRELDFSKIPDQFKMLDQKAVNKYASEKAEAPGIEFYAETQLSGK